MHILRWILAASLAANGLFMLGWPRAWYHAVPGVVATGPLNLHFVRDIGCAYLIAAVGLIWRTIEPSRGAAAALLGATFLLLHAGVHIAESLLGSSGLDTLLHHIPSVVLPALLALALAWPPRSHPQLSHTGRPEHAP